MANEYLKSSTYYGQLITDAVGNMNRLGCWSCAWSSCGSYFAWSKGQHLIDIIDWRTFQASAPAPLARPKPSVVAHLDCGGVVWSLDFCWCELPDLGGTEDVVFEQPQRKKRVLVLAAGLENGNIRIFNALTGSELAELQHFHGKNANDDGNRVVRALRFAPDSSGRFCSVGRDGHVKLWRLNSGNSDKLWKQDSVQKAGLSWLFAVAWKPDGSQIATAGSLGQLHIWNVVRQSDLISLGSAKSKSVTPNGQSMLPSSPRLSVSASNLTGSSPELDQGSGWLGKLASYLPTNWYSRMSVSASAETPASVNSDRWMLELVGPFEGNMTFEWNCVEFSKPDGCILFSGSEAGYLVAWSVIDRVPLYAFDHNDRIDRSLSLSPSVSGGQSQYLSPNGAEVAMSRSTVSYVEDEVDSGASTTCSTMSLSQSQSNASASSSSSSSRSSAESGCQSVYSVGAAKSTGAARNHAFLPLRTSPFNEAEMSDATPTPTNGDSFAENARQQAIKEQKRVERDQLNAKLFSDVLSHAVNAYSRKRDVSPNDTYEQLASSRRVRAICMAPRSAALISVADDGYTRIWMIDAAPSRFVTPKASGALRCETVTRKHEAVCLALSPDGRTLAIGSRDSSVLFYTMKNSCCSLQHICRVAIYKIMASTIAPSDSSVTGSASASPSPCIGLRDWPSLHTSYAAPEKQQMLRPNSHQSSASSGPVSMLMGCSTTSRAESSDGSSNMSPYLRASDGDVTPESFSVPSSSVKMKPKRDGDRTGFLSRLCALGLPSRLTYFLIMTNSSDLMTKSVLYNLCD